ncbi:MAG: hypothetical protein MJB14_09600 [Spirochaetes bacterium]|nr:hypothetical protein [Spirochaetota bacterium]
MKTVETFDVFEASYYLSAGKCILERVEVTTENSKKLCKVVVSGDDLPLLQKNYLHGEAVTNVFDFRRTYQHLMKLLSFTKREAARAERESELNKDSQEVTP